MIGSRIDIGVVTRCVDRREDGEYRQASIELPVFRAALRKHRQCGKDQESSNCAQQKPLFSEYIERGLELASGVRVVCYGDSLPVEVSRLVQIAELFERLPAVKIRGGIVRIGLQKRLELRHSPLQLPRFDVFHRQTVTGECAGRILFEELLQNFDASGFQTVRIPLRAIRMACPFFHPEVEAPWFDGRSPLGSTYQGSCSVQPSAPSALSLCNFGYARGRCEHFPESCAADAVRFSVLSNSENLLRICWVTERDHAPVAHGVLEYRDGGFSAPLEEPFGAQARAFVANYFAKR